MRKIAYVLALAVAMLTAVSAQAANPVTWNPLLEQVGLGSDSYTAPTPIDAGFVTYTSLINVGYVDVQLGGFFWLNDVANFNGETATQGGSPAFPWVILDDGNGAAIDSNGDGNIDEDDDQPYNGLIVYGKGAPANVSILGIDMLIDAGGYGNITLTNYQLGKFGGNPVSGVRMDGVGAGTAPMDVTVTGAVPEPSTLGLLGLALVGLFGLRRRS